MCTAFHGQGQKAMINHMKLDTFEQKHLRQALTFIFHNREREREATPHLSPEYNIHVDGKWSLRAVNKQILTHSKPMMIQCCPSAMSFESIMSKLRFSKEISVSISWWTCLQKWNICHFPTASSQIILPHINCQQSLPWVSAILKRKVSRPP